MLLLLPAHRITYPYLVCALRAYPPLDGLFGFWLPVHFFMSGAFSLSECKPGYPDILPSERLINWRRPESVLALGI